MPIKFLVKPINGSVLVFMEILACSCPKNRAAQSPNHSHMTVRHSGRPPGDGAHGGDPRLCALSSGKAGVRGAGRRQVHTPAESGSTSCPKSYTSQRCVCKSGTEV